MEMFKDRMCGVGGEEEAFEGEVVFGLVEEFLPADAAVHGVVEVTGGGMAAGSGHGGRVEEFGVGVK